MLFKARNDMLLDYRFICLVLAFVQQLSYRILVLCKLFLR